MAKAEQPRPIDGFQLYDVKVRLSGSRDNEARRFGVTAPEAMLLNLIHGPESLVECKPRDAIAMVHDEETGEPRPRTEREERARLVAEFEGMNPHKRGFVARVFGPAMGGGRLQRTMPDDFHVDGAVSVQRLPPDMPGDSVAAALA